MFVLWEDESFGAELHEVGLRLPSSGYDYGICFLVFSFPEKVGERKERELSLTTEEHTSTTKVTFVLDSLLPPSF